VESTPKSERLRTLIAALLFVGSLVLAFLVSGPERFLCLFVAALILLGQSHYNALNLSIGALRRVVDLLEQKLRQGFSALDKRCGMLEGRLKELAGDIKKLSQIAPLKPAPAASPAGRRVWPWVMVLVFLMLASNGAVLHVMYKKIAVLSGELQATGAKLFGTEASLETALKQVAELRSTAELVSARLESGLAALNPAWCWGRGDLQPQVSTPTAGTSASSYVSFALEGHGASKTAAHSLWFTQYAD